MKKLKPYLITIGIVLIIFLIIFLMKGIYPFGRHSLIWGDMHDQITAFYYHFYDSIKGNSSLLVNFSTSGGINFLGILAYYILSPFSFLVLMVNREDIYLVVSIIIALKILLSSLTCLYFIRYYFKKLPNLLAIVLAITYAFSGYSLIMYQITPWIDVMYLFPIIMIGLKKVLDLEKPTIYITSLALSLIFSFYVSLMVIIFIFLASIIYLYIYKDDKKKRYKGILALGITTVISLLLASFIVIPSYEQISISSRIGFNFTTLLNSKTGPITDKLSMFLFGGVVYLGLILLLKNHKKHEKFLKFYIPTTLIILIPAIIEPINKIWHFGSYAFFPYRAGFIAMFLLILGACYSYQEYKPIKEEALLKDKVKSIVLTLFIIVSIFIIMYVNYKDFQIAIETLTISANHILLLILVLSTIASIIGCYIVIRLNKKLNSLSLILIAIITFTHITVNTSIYLGMDQEQETLMSQYEELALISHDYLDKNYYRVKNEADNMIMNSGMVMRYHNIDHFTSLTDKVNLETLKKMGYSSMWVKTYSRGGNLFLDSILANGYLMTRNEIDNEYYKYIKDYKGLKWYELINKGSYGYFLSRNDTIFDKKNSFEISNSLYQNITNSNTKLFKIIDDFELHNIETSLYEGNTYYEIIDSKSMATFETTEYIEGKQTVYLEVLRSLSNLENYKIYENFNIYINDQLVFKKAFDEDHNGVLCLGTFEDEIVNIKIELRKSVDLDNITIGLMDNTKYEKFIKEESINTKVEYYENKVDVKVTGEKGKILFLPVAYNDSYSATNNGRKVEILKAYENFIGILLEDGENNIHISFMPKGFIPFLILSLITLVITIILLRTKLYDKLLNIDSLSKVTYYLYLFIYSLVMLFVYVGGILVFLISYFVTL